MRIAIVGQGDGRAVSTWSGIPYHLGQALSALGHEVVHVDANPGPLVRRPLVGALRAAGLPRTAASHGPEMAALRTIRVRRALRRISPDAVVQRDTGFLLSTRVPYVTFLDLTVPQALLAGWSDPAGVGPRRAGAWRRREETACRRARACCAASDWTTRSIVEDHGVPAGRVRTVGFGASAPTTPRRRDWSTPRFLFVGREWERKNGELVLRAFRRVRAEHPAATLTIVGDHPPVREDGVHDAGRLDAADPEDRAALVRLFETSTCFVMPSLLEPFGIVYLEAARAGLPSIATTVGGAATAVGPGGLLVDPGDEDAVHAAMRAFADGEHASAVGGRASAHAAQFTWELVARRVLDGLAG